MSASLIGRVADTSVDSWTFQKIRAVEGADLEVEDQARGKANRHSATVHCLV
ncbi:MAG TPA: hypothetical protein VI216_01095 [Candidatus Acidoferrales bacterium]